MIKTGDRVAFKREFLQSIFENSWGLDRGTVEKVRAGDGVLTHIVTVRWDKPNDNLPVKILSGNLRRLKTMGRGHTVEEAKADG